MRKSCFLFDAKSCFYLMRKSYFYLMRKSCLVFDAKKTFFYVKKLFFFDAKNFFLFDTKKLFLIWRTTLRGSLEVPRNFSLICTRRICDPGLEKNTERAAVRETEAELRVLFKLPCYQGAVISEELQGVSLIGPRDTSLWDSSIYDRCSFSVWQILRLFSQFSCTRKNLFCILLNWGCHN